jgi:hypothetical protein
MYGPNALPLFAVLIATIYVTITYGIARTFVFLFVPVMLFMSMVSKVDIPGLPDLSAESALGYGLIAGCMIAFPSRWQELSKVRLNVLDWFILLMMIPPTISVFVNDSAWDAISKTGDLFFRWVLPYFAARVAFLDHTARRALLPMICACAIGLGFLAAIEARLLPYFVTRSMEQLNLARVANTQVFHRFGLMRAQTSLGHPIDLGNMGVILGGMIIMLTPIAGRTFKEPLIIAGILASGAMVIGAVSFTGLTAMTAAFVFLFLFTRPNWGGKLVLPAILGLICFISLVMNSMLMKPIPEERPTDELEASVWIRVKIIQEGWEKATNAGMFGEGQYLSTAGIGTGSIDNAYILFVMQFGWGYLVMWVILALLLGWIGGRTLQLTGVPSERLPVAAVCASLAATLLAMYTVYFGFVYAIFFLVLVGVLSTMYQLFRFRPALPVMPVDAPQGIPYAMPGTPNAPMPRGSYR